MTGLVETGAELRNVRWLVIPDKYAGPSEVGDFAKALNRAAETGGRIRLLADAVNPDGTAVALDATLLDEEAEIVTGDRVVRCGFRVRDWRSGTSYPTASGAVASLPAGETADLYEEVWIGSREIRVTGPQAQVVGS